MADPVTIKATGGAIVIRGIKGFFRSNKLPLDPAKEAAQRERERREREERERRIRAGGAGIFPFISEFVSRRTGDPRPTRFQPTQPPTRPIPPPVSTRPPPLPPGIGLPPILGPSPRDVPPPKGGIFGALGRLIPALRILSGVIFGAQVIGGIIGPAIGIEEKARRDRIRVAKEQKAAKELEETKKKLRKRAAKAAEISTAAENFPENLPNRGQNFPKISKKIPEKIPEISPEKIREIQRIDPTEQVRVQSEVNRALERARARAEAQKRARQAQSQTQAARVQTRFPAEIVPIVRQATRTRTPAAPARPGTARPDLRDRLDTFRPDIGNLPTGQAQSLAQRVRRGRCVCKCKKTRKRKKPKLKCKEGFFRETMWGGEDFTVWRVVDCPPEAPPA